MPYTPDGEFATQSLGRLCTSKPAQPPYVDSTMTSFAGERRTPKIDDFPSRALSYVSAISDLAGC